IVQAMLVQNALGQCRLLAALASACLAHRREPHGATAPTPVVQTEFLQVGHTGHQLGAVFERLGIAGVFLGDDTALAELLEGVGDDLPVHVDLLLGTVQRCVQVPGAHAGVFLHLLQDFVRSVAGLGGVLGPGQVGTARFPQHVGNHHRVGNGVVHAQRTQGIDNLDDIFFIFEDYFEGLEHRRLEHQPEAHLGADTVVGLGEHAVQGRTVAPHEDLPAVAALHTSQAGAVDITTYQYHFHAALHHEMFAVGGVTHTTVHGVTHRAGNGRRSGERQHDRQVVFLNVVVQLAVGDARLDQRVAHFGIDLDDLVHLLQIQNHLATLSG